MEAQSEQSGCEGKANTEHLTHASKDGTDELNFKPLLHKVTFTEKNIGIYQYHYTGTSTNIKFCQFDLAR